MQSVTDQSDGAVVGRLTDCGPLFFLPPEFLKMMENVQ